MIDAENKILEEIYSYSYKKDEYESILTMLDGRDQSISGLYNLIEKLGISLRSMGRYRDVTPEEETFIRKHEIRAIDCYQRALDENYEMLRQYKETGIEPKGFKYLVLTVNKNGDPKMTRVIDVKDGKPVFEGGCEIETIDGQMREVDSLMNDLGKWLNNEGSLRKRLDRALKLMEGGHLGAETPPSPSYDLGGLSGGQLDAAAWQNYAIEMGMSRTVDYDYSLKRLIGYLRRCVDFYEKATSIV